MKPNNSENAGKATLAIVLVALGTAAKKYGPVVVEKAKKIIPIIFKKVLRRG